jgi:DNA primase
VGAHHARPGNRIERGPLCRQADGRQVDERSCYDEAIAIAQELKRLAPELLVTVWGLAARKADIIIEP